MWPFLGGVSTPAKESTKRVHLENSNFLPSSPNIPFPSTIQKGKPPPPPFSSIPSTVSRRHIRLFALHCSSSSRNRQKRDCFPCAFVSFSRFRRHGRRQLLLFRFPSSTTVAVFVLQQTEPFFVSRQSTAHDLLNSFFLAPHRTPKPDRFILIRSHGSRYSQSAQGRWRHLQGRTLSPQEARRVEDMRMRSGRKGKRTGKKRMDDLCEWKTGTTGRNADTLPL